MLKSNSKVTVAVKGSPSLGGEFKTVGEIKVSRSIVRSADHFGKADTLYKNKRRKFEPIELTRVCGKADWDNKATWLALDHDTVTVTELVYDDDGLAYGKGLVISGEITDVAMSARDLDDEDGLADLSLTIEPTDITEA